MVASHAQRFRQSRPAVDRFALESANGRVLANPLLADADQPPFPRSTRDGFACRAAEIATESGLPIVGTTRAGEPPAGALPQGAAWEIMTGAPIPLGADCVVMLEHVVTKNGKLGLAPGRSISPGDNIVPQGAQARGETNCFRPGYALGLPRLHFRQHAGKQRLKYSSGRVSPSSRQGTKLFR